MSARRAVEENWYDYPRYYDIAFRTDTQREANFFEAAFQKYCDFPVRRLLEPACGTGRLVVELASRGYCVTGFDLSRPMLDYVQKQVKRRKLSARVTTFEGDMADFETPKLADAAYCPINTFRHLLTESAAKKHLECVAESLRPGGIYILGLHLLPPDVAEESNERWTERDDKTQVTVTLRVLETDRRRRVEKLRVCLLAREDGREWRLRHDFQFRMYTPRQFQQLLRSVPSFELCDLYDFWYEIDSPIRWGNDMADTVFVLKKK